MLLHFFPAHIQYQLLPGLGAFPAIHMQAPVRMGTVQITVRRYHFRLKPKAHLEPHGIDLFRQQLQTAGQLFFIHHPVPKRTVIRVPLAEPAVIQHK